MLRPAYGKKMFYRIFKRIFSQNHLFRIRAFLNIRYENALSDFRMLSLDYHNAKALIALQKALKFKVSTKFLLSRSLTFLIVTWRTFLKDAKASSLEISTGNCVTGFTAKSSNACLFLQTEKGHFN
jgi:hypothetical protein